MKLLATLVLAIIAVTTVAAGVVLFNTNETAEAHSEVSSPHHHWNINNVHEWIGDMEITGNHNRNTVTPVIPHSLPWGRTFQRQCSTSGTQRNPVISCKEYVLRKANVEFVKTYSGPSPSDQDRLEEVTVTFSRGRSASHTFEDVDANGWVRAQWEFVFESMDGNSSDEYEYYYRTYKRGERQGARMQFRSSPLSWQCQTTSKSDSEEYLVVTHHNGSRISSEEYTLNKTSGNAVYNAESCDDTGGPLADVDNTYVTQACMVEGGTEKCDAPLHFKPGKDVLWDTTGPRNEAHDRRRIRGNTWNFWVTFEYGSRWHNQGSWQAYDRTLFRWIEADNEPDDYLMVSQQKGRYFERPQAVQVQNIRNHVQEPSD